MELEEATEKALTYQSRFKYLEARGELKQLLRSCLDLGSDYLENISNTSRGHFVKDEF